MPLVSSLNSAIVGFQKNCVVFSSYFSHLLMKGKRAALTFVAVSLFVFFGRKVSSNMRLRTVQINLWSVFHVFFYLLN